MQKHKRTLLAILILCCIGLVLSAQSKPNIVVILADDMGYGTANCYGTPESLLRTPHIDQMADEGMRFTDASTPASLCSPTRYAFLTGRYAWRGKLKYGVLQPPEGALLIEDELFTLPEYLQKHGYATAHVGKWHLGYTNMDNVEDLSAQPLVPGPRSLGFDYHFAVPNQIDWLPKVYIENEGIWGLRSKGKNPYGKSFYKGQAYHGYDAPQRVTTEVTQDLSDAARNWIFKTVRQEPGKPFFLYFAMVAVHHPISPSEKLRGSSAVGAYGDFVHDLDHSVGEIMDALAYAGVLENTLVIFTSDNGGDFCPEEQLAREKGFRNNGDFRGDKHTIWEGGVRVPFIARWPGQIQEGSVSDRMINLVDIYATIQEMVGGKILSPEDAASDSFSFFDELMGERNANALRPHMVINDAIGVQAIRKGPWKYIEGVPAAPLSEGRRKELESQLQPQLYNLEKDVSESNNCIKDHPEVYQDLQATLDQIRELGSERIIVQNESK
ncbi:MAG: arylsulfatase [Bacteroides sp.]|nr:arylsulfatase [Bacteroides sp.]